MWSSRNRSRYRGGSNTAEIGTPGIIFGILGSSPVLQKLLGCSAIRSAEEPEGYNHQHRLALVVGAALLALIATVPMAHAQQARIVVKHRPIVNKGDVSESWDARQNVLASKRYE